jgi:hypothetical protein
METPNPINPGFTRLTHMDRGKHVEMSQEEHDATMARRAAYAAELPARLAARDRDRLIRERMQKDAYDKAEQALIDEQVIQPE